MVIIIRRSLLDSVIVTLPYNGGHFAADDRAAGLTAGLTDGAVPVQRPRTEMGVRGLLGSGCARLKHFKHAPSAQRTVVGNLEVLPQRHCDIN